MIKLNGACRVLAIIVSKIRHLEVDNRSLLACDHTVDQLLSFSRKVHGLGETFRTNWQCPHLKELLEPSDRNLLFGPRVMKIGQSEKGRVRTTMVEGMETVNIQALRVADGYKSCGFSDQHTT